VLGVGHLFRSIEISKALQGHDVVFISGGPPTGVSLPSQIREISLPGLMMDREFSSLLTVETNESIDNIKNKRKRILFDAFKKEAPDFFLIELYPFGRKAFRFELDPILEGIRDGHLGQCKVICSLRDILVEKKDAAAYEDRVVSILNRFFDVLLVHSDPSVISLEQSFSRIKDISIPLVYTGFVTPKPLPGAGINLRKRIGLSKKEHLIVVSAGGGKVGFDLISSVMKALSLLQTRKTLHSYIFTGPFLNNKDFSELKSSADRRTHVERFTDDFLSFLAAADLSISMAGYNTCMNLLAADVPALIWPFAQNREQRLRAERLASLGNLQILEDHDLKPRRLAEIMENSMTNRADTNNKIDLEGARNTANWFNRGLESRGISQ
jgi:predicted glycosyltransferase